MPSDALMSDFQRADWAQLSEELQLLVANSALQRAAETLAWQAETLADEIDAGVLADLGGADALRLFAAIARLSGRQPLPPAGHA